MARLCTVIAFGCVCVWPDTVKRVSLPVLTSLTCVKQLPFCMCMFTNHCGSMNLSPHTQTHTLFSSIAVSKSMCTPSTVTCAFPLISIFQNSLITCISMPDSYVQFPFQSFLSECLESLSFTRCHVHGHAWMTGA